MSDIKKFLQDEEGQSMVEYGVTLGAVAAVAYIAVVVLGDRIADIYAWMANHLPGGENDDLGQVRASGEEGLSNLETRLNDDGLQVFDFGTPYNDVNGVGGNSLINNFGSGSVWGSTDGWTGD
jgi:pilus assembly protein Flp/PilA